MKNLCIILNNWNISYETITEVQKDVWRLDDTYYLKANTNPKWISNLQIYKTIREHGIPAPEVIKTKQGKDYVTHSDINYFLTRKLEGVHLNKEDIMNDATKARSIGKVIAKLHKIFAAITDQFEFKDNDFISELNGWIKDSIEKFAKDSYTYRILEDCISELTNVYDKLERHLILRDMHLGNLLFCNNQITGYIDFDLTQINARIFDLAYFLVGWIVGEVHNDTFMDRWKETVKIVMEGYEEEQELSNQEYNALGIMMCCIEILFAAYFYHMNDLENALQAEECLRWVWKHRNEIIQEEKRIKRCDAY